MWINLFSIIMATSESQPCIDSNIVIWIELFGLIMTYVKGNGR